MLETAQKYELSFLRACRKVDISWDCLQFLCTNLCRKLLKSISYPFSEHAEWLILAETLFNFYASAYAGVCSKVWFTFFWEHAERLILGKTVFDFYALAYVGDCSKVIWDHAQKLGISCDGLRFYALACAGAYWKIWVILPQSMQKTWY